MSETTDTLVRSAPDADASAGPATAGRGRLRVGLLVDSFVQPEWVARIIRDIRTSTVAEVALVVRNKADDEINQRTKSRARGIWENREHLLHAVYTKFDERRSVGPDAFALTDAAPLLTDCPVVEVAPLMKKHTDYFSDEDVRAIRSYDLDVALRFGFRILKGEALKIARHGVWSYHHGDNLVNRGGPAGFWEVFQGETVTGSVLQVLNEELDNGQVIQRSWAPTADKFSVKLNRNNFYWKSAGFVMRKLRELHASDGRGLDDAVHGAEPYRPYYKRLYRRPTNREMLPMMLRLAGRYAAERLRRAVSVEQWQVAYRFRTGPSDPNNAFYKFKYLTPPIDRAWADPFPVRVGDKYYVFVEDYPLRGGKGHISVFELERGVEPGPPVKVLERDYHLSYPFVFEWRGDHYMIPETGASGRVELYRARSFPAGWELEAVLLEGVRAADATLAEVGGQWWMFVSIAEPGVACNWDELSVFHAESPLGPWRPHRRNPVKSDVRGARPAGRLFEWGGELYRPAQDCSKHYGYAVTINRVTRLSPEEFAEEEVSKILPEWDDRLVSTHTLNSAGDLTVIDCLRRRRKYLAGR